MTVPTEALRELREELRAALEYPLARALIEALLNAEAPLLMLERSRIEWECFKWLYGAWKDDQPKLWYQEVLEFAQQHERDDLGKLIFWDYPDHRYLTFDGATYTLVKRLPEATKIEVGSQWYFCHMGESGLHARADILCDAVTQYVINLSRAGIGPRPWGKLS